jgi:hypothetical protein
MERSLPYVTAPALVGQPVAFEPGLKTDQTTIDTARLRRD